MKIIKHAASKPFVVDVKRFHVPYTIESNCPRCGAICKINLTHDYLPYPTVGKSEKIYFYCSVDECYTEWQENVKLTITLEPA